MRIINTLLKIKSFKKLYHSYIYKMDKAYMRCPPGSAFFELSFQYFNSNLNVNRQFNFSRKLSEPVSVFLTRVSTNLDKIINKKKKKGSALTPIPFTIKLYQNGQEVPSHKPCEELFKSGGNIQLKLIDQEYEVVINTPWVKNVELPTSMLANFPVYPAKFESLFIDKQETEFKWFKSLDSANWTPAGTGFIFVPTTDDIDCFVKLSVIPKNGDSTGPETITISKNKIEAEPGQCPFEIRHEFTKEKLTGNNFRVITYNLLADLYCDSDYSRTVLFPYCPEYALNIHYRKQLILKEIIGFNVDIMCLQEVDEKVFDNDLTPVLAQYGFHGKYFKKGGTLREGLACFYNATRFNLLDSISIILGETLETNPLLLKNIWSKISNNTSLVKRLKDRSTILQITILESLQEEQEILIVANTHLYFHPDADHIRLLQAGISNVHIDDMVRQTKLMYPEKRVSVIYCGDFNSAPENGIYKLFTTGFVPDCAVDWQSNPNEAVEGISLENSRLLVSACGTPKYTNYTVGFQDCLDYIFYEKGNFEVTQVIPFISDEELSQHIAIPSVVVPSDHMSLVADLKWL